MILEGFLTHHGISMLPTARLCHYGRRFRLYFPSIVQGIQHNGRWGSKSLLKLATYVASLDPDDFTKLDGAVAPKLAKKYRSQNRIQTFLHSWDWKRLRYQVLTERGRECEACGANPSQIVDGKRVTIQVDHIKPISKYWHLRLEKSNLQCLCSACNMGKGNWDETDWRKVA